MNKSRLFVFQIKEIIYTLLFLILAIILIVVLVNMFNSDKLTNTSSTTSSSYSTQYDNNILSNSENNKEVTYVPGIYSTKIDLNNQTINLQVTVDKHQIKSVSATNLSDTIEVMYPLLEPSIEYIETELAKGTSIEDIEYDSSSIYTGTMLTEAITTLLDRAAVSSEQR